MNQTVTTDTILSPSSVVGKVRRPQSLWGESYRRLKKNKGAVVSAYFILFVCLVALFAEKLAPFPFAQQDMTRILHAPSSHNWLGTDSLGRDLLSRIIFGARMSMAVGIFTAITSLVIGVFVGAVSGWFGGRVDSFIMRLVDIIY